MSCVAASSAPSSCCRTTACPLRRSPLRPDSPIKVIWRDRCASSWEPRPRRFAKIWPRHADRADARALGCRSGRWVLLQLQLFDHAFAHHEFLNLAGHRHRKLLDEADVLRHFEVRDLLATEANDLLRRASFARATANPGAHHFAVTRIRHAEDLHVLDLRMTKEKLLDLAR